MERNTLLAIALSALVLYSYAVIFPPPKQTVPLKNSQNTTAQVLAPTNSVPTVIPVNSGEQPTILLNKTSDYEIKTKNTNISFTNVGGLLHNVYFIGKVSISSLV